VGEYKVLHKTKRKEIKSTFGAKSPFGGPEFFSFYFVQTIYIYILTYYIYLRNSHLSAFKTRRLANGSYLRFPFQTFRFPSLTPFNLQTWAVSDPPGEDFSFR